MRSKPNRTSSLDKLKALRPAERAKAAAVLRKLLPQIKAVSTSR